MLEITENNKNEYKVYLIYNQSNMIEYIGVDKLKDIITLNAINTNPFYNSEELYKIDIIGSYANRKEAQNIANDYIMIYETPRMNKPYKRFVKCITNGEIFPTAAQACNKYGISPSNMCHHLSRTMGYNKLKGLEFCYITTEVRDE